MTEKIALASDPEEIVEEARVPDIDFRRLDLALPQVLVPWRQLARHEETAEQVEVAPRGGFAHTQRSCRVRRIPNLPMVMREHRPETKYRRGGNRDSHL